MFPRNGKYRILTTKSVIATVHLPKEGLEEMATQGCIHPHYSSLQLDTIPEVVSPWRPVESNEGRRFTNLIAPWWSQADMCVVSASFVDSVRRKLRYGTAQAHHCRCV